MSCLKSHTLLTYCVDVLPLRRLMPLGLLKQFGIVWLFNEIRRSVCDSPQQSSRLGTELGQIWNVRLYGAPTLGQGGAEQLGLCSSSMKRGEWEGDQGCDLPGPQLCFVHYGFFWAHLCTQYLIAYTCFVHHWEIMGLPEIKKNKKGKVIRSADTRSNLGFKTLTTSRLLNKPISNFFCFKAKALFSRASGVGRQQTCQYS